MFTLNEKNVLKMIFTVLDNEYSINNIAKNCNITPNGALKILKKFEKEGVLKSKKVANIKSYSINFENEKTKNILELVLIPDLRGRLKYRIEDLSLLREVTKAAIIFGSYVDLKKEPNDLDILFILGKTKFKAYKDKSSRIYEIIPVKVHDVLQTEEDFKANIIKKDKVILEILKKGIILWGQKKIVELVENGYKKLS